MRRDEINAKLNALEKQKFFRSEIQIRQKQLNICKRETDELKYGIKQKRALLQKLKEQEKNLNQKYDTSEVEKTLKERTKEMKEVEARKVNEKGTTDSLQYMLNAYKQDILSLKMKVQRWKKLMKMLTLEENDLKVKEKKLNARVGKLLTNLLKGQHELPPEAQELDVMFNQDIEDELSIYEDRITLGQIATHEKDLEFQKEMEKLRRRKKMELQKERKSKEAREKRVKDMKDKRRSLFHRKREIDGLLKVMKISDPNLIEATYEGLM